MLECVVNVSEGRDRDRIAELANATGPSLLDVHSDPDHHRSVFTVAGDDTEEAVHRLTALAVGLLDIAQHSGVHPRIGVVDVVPFVALDAGGAPDPTGIGRAVTARDRFCVWMASMMSVPCFSYGPERTLVEVRRRAFRDLDPDTGPPSPHPTAGACAVGARPVLVAYNMWLDTGDLSVARAVAADVRGGPVRSLGLAVAGVTQVSCNLLDPLVVGPADVYEKVAESASSHGTVVTRAEVVGLVPAAMAASIPAAQHRQLDIDGERTIESRLAAARRRAE